MVPEVERKKLERTPGQGLLTITKGLTEKLAEYEFARVDISIQVPFDLDKREEVFKETVKYLDEKLYGQMDQMFDDYHTSK